VKKNRLKFFKNRPVRFYKPETEKTEPNQTQTGKKPSETRKNRAKPEVVGLNRFLF
jgi:hypothetical protein